MLSAFRSLRYVGADRLKVPRHPLSDLVPKYGPLDNRGAVVHTVVDACVDDFFDDLVRALEVMDIRFSFGECSSGEVDAARQTLRAEELRDRVSVGTRAAPVGRRPLRMSRRHDLWPPVVLLLRCVVSVDIRVLDRGDRAPEVVKVFRVPAGNECIGLPCVDLREETRGFPDIVGQTLIERQLSQILYCYLRLRVDRAVKKPFPSWSVLREFGRFEAPEILDFVEIFCPIPHSRAAAAINAELIG